MRLFSYFDAFQPLHRKDLIFEMIPLNQASQNEEDLSSPRLSMKALSYFNTKAILN